MTHEALQTSSSAQSERRTWQRLPHERPFLWPSDARAERLEIWGPEGVFPPKAAAQKNPLGAWLPQILGSTSWLPPVATTEERAERARFCQFRGRLMPWWGPQQAPTQICPAWVRARARLAATTSRCWRAAFGVCCYAFETLVGAAGALGADSVTKGREWACVTAASLGRELYDAGGRWRAPDTRTRTGLHTLAAQSKLACCISATETTWLVRQSA